METLKVRLTGDSPLLMHSARGANPLDAGVKAHKMLTIKRKKLDQDHDAIARSEWEIALYYDPELGPYLPSTNVRSAIVEGGRLNKLGAAVQRGTLIADEKLKLLYKGPRTPDELWAKQFVDARSVVVGTSRLMRYRPAFPRGWSLEVEIYHDPSVIDAGQLTQCLENAGRLIGLGDFRPNRGGPFGRFTSEVVA